MNHWVHDYETLKNCFVAVFEHYKEDNIRKVFVIHELQNDLQELIDFLEENSKNGEWHISFNGLSFDSQITEFILRNQPQLTFMTGGEVAEEIYKKAQNVITRQDRGEWNEFSEKDLHIRQVDVFKLNHWDNPAKRSSLKWIQYSMDWDNIQEMPIHHESIITTREEINTIISYCINDVRSTKRIMQLSKEQINLRQSLTSEYKVQLYSASEPRISKELFLLFLSKKTGISKWELKQLRTNREIITIKDLILPYTKFKTKVFQDLLDGFNSLTVNPNKTKDGFHYTVGYKGVETDFGLGGVHGCAEPGIYKSGNGMIIMTSDVTSFYPNLAIRNGWAPAHLPQKEFCEQYEWFFEERKKIPKKDPRNYVYKIILNSTYGLSNDRNSFLYDPEFTMRVTINGQLTLMMLYEMLAEGIPNCTPLMQNTDGLEMLIPEEYKEKYLEICKEWETITNLQLEHDEYQKIILADVNNYIAINKAGKHKCKGRFEFEDLALHKNKSYLIVRKALFNYFVHDIPPERFLIENRNIFDYCAGVKVKSDWKLRETSIINQEICQRDLQKTLRYYISNKGSKIIKIHKKDGREIQLEAGKWMQTDLSLYQQKSWEEYDVDDSYYLESIYKEIHNIQPVKSKQLNLFSDMSEPIKTPSEAEALVSKVGPAASYDPVNKPSHYTDGNIEVIDFIEDKKLGFHLGNAVKYIARAGKKDPAKTLEDLQKAKWYLERQIKNLSK
ncbi:MAG: DUF3310 domain-containing protein [Chryseobacterium sp.]|nr:MAG: DUF3310 domain-containing protein [Chryseobacterium sp.]